LARRSFAASNTFFRSATPEKIADICSKASSVSPASSRATVVPTSTRRRPRGVVRAWLTLASRSSKSASRRTARS